MAKKSSYALKQLVPEENPKTGKRRKAGKGGIGPGGAPFRAPKGPPRYLGPAP